MAAGLAALQVTANRTRPMAKSASKRGPKPPKPTKPTTKTPPSKPPEPFEPAPEALQPFLDTLDPAKIYITHIDTHPPQFKRKVFSVPILMNIGILVLLAWRLYAIVPFYFSIVLSTLGNPSDATVDVAHSSWAQLAAIALRRAGNFALDFVLFKYILPWPFTFLANPCVWRWTIGFQAREIIVRVSRRSWDAAANPAVTSAIITDPDSAIFLERILPAIDRAYVARRTGYIMMDKSWDLDFAAMMCAHDLVARARVAEAEFQKTVIMHSDPFGWIVWPVWQLDEGGDEVSRKKIVAFKDRLTLLGHESLFFRWIEIVQYESTQEGGFTPQRQASAMRQAKELFEKHGIDFDEFFKDLGGVDGLPGMEGMEDGGGGGGGGAAGP
ncbi:MAG: hypothetical protein M1819_003960 [Sarea resinae]|nr:MAG: hypothetical protein M1819_003960 [Sarea resinae]